MSNESLETQIKELRGSVVALFLVVTMLIVESGAAEEFDTRLKLISASDAFKAGLKEEGELSAEAIEACRETIEGLTDALPDQFFP